MMAETPRILIADEMSSRAVDVLRQAGFTVDVRTGLPPAELAAVVGEYHGLGVRSATRVSAAVLAQPGKLRIIGRAGVGVDNIDVEAATKRDIVVINTPSGNAVAAAELAVSLLFALARKVPQAAAGMRQGQWEKKKFMGVELAGKTFGVLGLGNIGRHVVRRGVGLDMQVIAHDPYLPAEIAAKLGAEFVSFDDLVRRSDFLSIHVPLAPQTQGLFDAGTLRRMKTGAYLINCARGGIVDEDALLAALQSGQLSGAALDVFETEPPGLTPLLAHESIIATPHIGASTKEAQEKVAVELAEVFVAFLKDGVVRNAVNRRA